MSAIETTLNIKGTVNQLKKTLFFLYSVFQQFANQLYVSQMLMKGELIIYSPYNLVLLFGICFYYKIDVG